MNKSNLFNMVFEIMIAIMSIVTIAMGKDTLWISITILVCAIISIVINAISLKDKQ